MARLRCDLNRASRLAILVAFPAIFAMERAAAAPSVDCATAPLTRIERDICADPELIDLDGQLNAIYGYTLTQFSGKRAARLEAEQRSWIRRRNQCRRSVRKACLLGIYNARITALERHLESPEGTAPQVYRCKAGIVYFVTFLKGDKPVVRIADGNPKTPPVVAALDTTTAGERYTSPTGMTFWAKGREAEVETPGGAKLSCRLK